MFVLKLYEPFVKDPRIWMHNEVFPTEEAAKKKGEEMVFWFYTSIRYTVCELKEVGHD